MTTQSSNSKIRVEVDESKVKYSPLAVGRPLHDDEKETAKVMAGELPQKKNIRGGPGWWMDEQGRWCDPRDWPGNEPPVDGWVRSEDGAWCPPQDLTDDVDPATGEKVGLAPEAEPTRSSHAPTTADGTAQAESDSAGDGSRVAALLIAGTAVAVAVVVSIGVVLMQSGAEALPEDSITDAPEVVFAAETEELRVERRIEAAAEAPEVALRQLDQLQDRNEPAATGETADDVIAFDEALWEAQPTDCLDPAELVLIERSATPVVWADNHECVPAEGAWFDPYVDANIERTIDAEVRSLIPLEIVHDSGGNEWMPATRALFVNDVTHPATLVILLRDSEHNPRNQGPDQWRPSNESQWCGYAIDWIAVKHRWELTVTPSERSALTDMVQTCSTATSSGPHLTSMVIDPIDRPSIERIEEN